MAAGNDPHSGAPFIEEGTVQAELVANRALQMVSAWGQIRCVSGLTTNGNAPPGSPNDGDVYFTGSAATGDWNGHNSVFAQWIGSDDTGGDPQWFFTASKEGVIAYDISTNKYYRFTSATAKVEMNPVVEQSKCFTILNPSTSEDLPFMTVNRAATITRIHGIIKGTGSPARTFTLRKSTDPTATGTEVVTSGTLLNSTTTIASVTSFNSASIPTANMLRFQTTATGASGTVSLIQITVFYTEDG